MRRKRRANAWGGGGYDIYYQISNILFFDYIFLLYIVKYKFNHSPSNAMKV